MLLQTDHYRFFCCLVEMLKTNRTLFVSLIVTNSLFYLVSGELWNLHVLLQQKYLVFVKLNLLLVYLDRFIESLILNLLLALLYFQGYFYRLCLSLFKLSPLARNAASELILLTITVFPSTKYTKMTRKTEYLFYCFTASTWESYLFTDQFNSDKMKSAYVLFTMPIKIKFSTLI